MVVVKQGSRIVLRDGKVATDTSCCCDCPEGRKCGENCCPDEVGWGCCAGECCPPGSNCVDGVCCPYCGDECCTPEQECCSDVCCDTECCGGLCPPPGVPCCNGECFFDGCDWYTVCEDEDAGSSGTVCGQYTAYSYDSEAPYNSCGGENNGQSFVEQTIDKSPFADLPLGIEWQAGYPGAINDDCPWAVVTDYAGSTCCQAIEEVPYFQGTTQFRRRVRLLRVLCDGTLQDITADALTGSGTCWGSTDIDRIAIGCGTEEEIICDSPEDPPFLPFFPDPVFVCPP